MYYIRITMLYLLSIFYLQASDEIETTFAMIKPYAINFGKTEEIFDMIEQAGFTVLAMKELCLTAGEVYQLYEDKKDRRWFVNYVAAMTASPVIVMILQKENAVHDWDFCKKKIRAHYATICRKNNVVHGSDSVQAAQRDIALFFDNTEYF